MKDIAELHQQIGGEQLASAIQRHAKPVQIDRQTASGYDDQTEPELPEIKSGRELRGQNLVVPGVVIHGLLHEGSKMVLGGGSKSFKTWCLGDLALSVTSGVPWWGIQTNKGKVLYINFEIQEPFFLVASKASQWPKDWVQTPWINSTPGTSVDFAPSCPSS